MKKDLEEREAVQRLAVDFFFLFPTFHVSKSGQGKSVTVTGHASFRNMVVGWGGNTWLGVFSHYF